MPAELSAAYIGAIAAIIAAIIGLIVAVTSAVIAKEQKVSEFRQAWINDLRNEVAAMLAGISSLTNELLYLRKKLNQLDRESTLEEELDLSLKMKNVVELMYKVTLRLNPEKDKEIIEHIGSIKLMLSELLNDIKNNLPMRQIRIKRDYLSIMFHKTFKSEWEKVKSGEEKFIMFRNFGELLLFAFIAAFFVVLAFIKIPELAYLLK